MRKILLAAAGLLALILPTQLQAQTDFPTKPIRIIIGGGAGGATDIVARLIADDMQAFLGQPVVVENKPGGGGLVAMDYYSRLPADGHTLIAGSSTFVMAPMLYSEKMKYDYYKVFRPLAALNTIPAFLVATKEDFAPKSVQELIDYAKAHPGQVRYGSAGIGGIQHWHTMIFAKQAGIDVVHIPNTDGAPAFMADLARGDTHFVDNANIAIARPLVDAGKVLPLAVDTEERVAEYPDVPTLGEVGFPNVKAQQWGALFINRETPQEIQDKLHAAVAAALNSPTVKANLAKQGFIPVQFATQAEDEAWVAERTAAWAEIVEIVGTDIVK